MSNNMIVTQWKRGARLGDNEWEMNQFINVLEVEIDPDFPDKIALTVTRSDGSPDSVIMLSPTQAQTVKAQIEIARRKALYNSNLKAS